jgi:beta-glucosidase
MNAKRFIPLSIIAVALIGMLLMSSVLFTAAQDDDGLAPDGKPGESYFAPFDVAVALDGDAAEWAGVPMVTMPGDAGPDAGKAGVTFAAASDSENLYLLGMVYDDNIISGEHGTDYWNEDSLEFYINGTGDLTLGSYVDGTVQITIPALNATTDDTVITGIQGPTAEATIEAVTTDYGWMVEVAVPLENSIWKIRPEHGNVIGFQVHLNGASTRDRDTKLIWSIYDASDQSYLNPSLFGRLVFFEIGQPPDPNMGVPQPTPTPIPVDLDADYRKPWLSTDERVEDLLGRMTLDEKIGQMTLVEKGSITGPQVTAKYIGGVLSGGGGSPADNTPQAWRDMVHAYQEAALQTRLGIPVIYGVDAVHGHNNVVGAVIYPHNIGLGMADDPDLVKRIGQATANEMIATGIYWNYAPVLAVVQDIRWGRAYEAFGQDTDLVTRLALAYIAGQQGDDLSAPLTVLTTPKHYVGDGGVLWGTGSGDYDIDQGDMQVDEATLRAVHLPPYEAAIEAGAQSIMISFSSWNGTKMHGNPYLITDVLKGELGFEGFVVSDWAGIDQVDLDYYTAVVTAINAGIDMNMVPYNYERFIATMKQAVEQGDISEERIDDAVRRILTVKFDLGLFEYPHGHDELLDYVGGEAHRALAREAVQKSLVLLKNEGDLLPLATDTPLIYVAGQAADDVGIQLGGWSISWQGGSGDVTPGTTLLEGIEATVSADTRVVYNRAGNFSDNTDADGNPIVADVCVVVVGERPYAEGQGDDPRIRLPRGDRSALNNTAEYCDQLVVVLISGRPLMITDHIDDWDAVLAAWLPGTEGQGVIDGLFGLTPITGQLSFEWPASIDQLPLGSTDDAPLFPMGYGLETEAAPPEVDEGEPIAKVMADFEGEIGYTQDEYGNNIGFVPWGDTADNLVLDLVPAEDDLARPDQTADNTILRASYDIAAFGGFTHVLTDGESWVPQDWTAYDALDFWLYGANSGGTIQVEIFDNRAPESTADTAERWYYRIPDDFEGWQHFSIPFADFQRRSDWQPSGAPDDGLGLTAVHGYAFGFPAGVGAQVNSLDEVTLTGTTGSAPNLLLPVPRPEVYMPPPPIPYNYDAAWELAWSDEFDAAAGAPINDDFWTCEVGGGGWGNAQLEHNTDRVENVAHDGAGQLVITAREESFKGNDYTSARCNTKDKYEFTYGKVEARMKLPEGQGIWPAFWMLGADFPDVGWPDSGEIDIMEFVGKEPQTTYGTVHGPGYSGASGLGAPRQFDANVSDDYHVFGIEWEPNVIRWYVDGELFNTVTPETLAGRQWVFDHDFFLLINLAVGGYWPGNPDATTQFPQELVIDWIRVYQRGEDTAADSPGTPADPLLADFADGISMGQDEYGNNIGFVPWGDTPDNVVLEVVPAEGDLALDGVDSALSVSFDVAAYGGFTHVLTDGESWVSQDWTAYDALDFWLYGANSGGTIQVEIFDNRAPDSTSDTAERWYYRIPDDFEGWQHFSIPFAEFQRRSDWQPGGAPDDGLGLTEVHGYVLGMPAGVGAHTVYLAQVELTSAD